MSSDSVSSSEISRAADILRAGGLVALPTETVYGLAANALDERAVARVFDVKGRPRFDPLIVHVPDIHRAVELTTEFPAAARRLAERFWPGPLTLVLPKQSSVPDLVTAGCPTVAIRVPDHPVALELLRAVEFPLAAPSANPFGRISPTTAEHVREQLGDQIDFILDGGPCRVGVESTVLMIAGDALRLLRPGGVTLEDIEAVVGPISIASSEEHPTARGLSSPGTLPQHYAPRTPLVVLEGGRGEMAKWRNGEHKGRVRKVGLLTFLSPDDSSAFTRVEVLSPAGDLREAAANFFAALRRLDAAGLDLIVALPFPEIGLGRALNDRLRRAAHH